MKETSGPFVTIVLATAPWIGATVSATLFIGLPLSALSISWFCFFRNRQSRFSGATVALIVLTLSYATYLGGLWIPGILGKSYSDHRFVVIAVNLAVCWVLVVLSLILVMMGRGKNNRLWDWVLILAFILAPLWYFVAAINSAV